MEPRGKIVLQGEIDALSEHLENYLGMQSEIRLGLKPETIVEKPKELVLYEMVKELGIPLVAGGVMDQPYIWLIQYAVCRNLVNLFDALARSQGQNVSVPTQPTTQA